MAYRWTQAAALALALAGEGQALSQALAQALAQAPFGGRDFDASFDRGLDEWGWREEEDAIVRRDGWRGRGGPGGSICVTSRGNCVVEPAPANAPCRCMIPGFGWKRGGVVE